MSLPFVRCALLAFVLATGLITGCRDSTSVEVASTNTLAELRSIKGTLTVEPPGERARAPYRRERLLDSEKVVVDSGGLAWMRRDGGATWLVSGPARFVVRRDTVELEQGRVFIDSERGEPASLRTPRGSVELSDARGSVELNGGELSIYVLRGSARADGAGRVGAGQRLRLTAGGRAQREAAVSWEDWTGGLATADASLDPAPFGIGTVGARKPGDQGKPRTSLVIRRLDVNVTIENDFAVTEVDETFVNPTSEVVEGIYSFRTPLGAMLERFGVDRDGELVWGRIQESVSAEQQYQSNVYRGSQEDPALLQWIAAGTYQARLFPINAGTSRRVVTRYSEWLSRQGARGERRLYVYPMAAEGAKGSLPRIEEFTVTLDLSRAGARAVRAGMGARREGQRVVVKAFDLVPRADLAVELFDDGQVGATAYRTRHALGARDVPENASAKFAEQVSRAEPDYLAIPVRVPAPQVEQKPGIDLAVVVDASAATEASALSLARVIAGSLLLHLGPDDRAALWTGDATLRPVAANSGALSAVSRETRRAWLAGLAAVERGGATDIGALMTGAAMKLDPSRRGAVVYIGDGAPSVGELLPKALRERLARLSPNTRVLIAAVGSQPNLTLLEAVARGAPVERVDDGYGAAESALRLLEAASRPIWVGARLELGPGIERVLPRELPAVGDETSMVVGRVSGKIPSEVVLRNGPHTSKQKLKLRLLDDAGDLRRRWGEARLGELVAEGAGRASLVDTARRYGLVSPFTSLYVPTRNEKQEPSKEQEPEESEDQRRSRLLRWKPWALAGGSREESPVVMSPDLPKAAKVELRSKAAVGTAAQAPAEASPATTAQAELPPQATAVSAPRPVPASALTRARGPRNGGAPRAAESLQKAHPGALGGAASDALSGSLDEPEARRDSGSHSRAVAPRLALVEHEPSPCGAAADLPLPERLGLWRERLASAASPGLSLELYQSALRACEATDWRARSALLIAIVDRLSSVRDRVELWRLLLAVSPRAADAVYRFLLLRVQTSAQLKEFHDALGLERIDPDLLKSFLDKARTPAERLAALRGAAERFSDDAELALLVLEAYEDAGDQAGGRAWARKLRRRADATAHVRTNVGEYYLRLAASEGDHDKQRDSEEARRTFGELVEFAPEDPLTRRLLGDLLRAHGWFEEALRQYQTLAALTPEDPSVSLYLALAAQGMGKTEEAVRWAEKAAQSGAPDGASQVPLAARALTSAFLGWAREASAKTGKTDEVTRLRQRARRLAAAEAGRGVRVVLSWAHPELRPALWTDALGSMLPADDNLPLLGVGQVFVPEGARPLIEVRLDPEDAARAARLGASVRLTVLEREGSADERIASVDFGFRSSDGGPRERVRFRVSEGSLREEQP